MVDLPNVRSVVFKEHEGSYLVGVLAAMASKSGKVGFVGGMDIPLIRKFACGYVQGVKAANPQAEVFQNMTGTTPARLERPGARRRDRQGARSTRAPTSIYAAAGGTGIGVLQAAADAGKLGIGVDSNQNYLHPGTVLTSMLKRVDVAVYNAFKDGEGRQVRRRRPGARPARKAASATRSTTTTSRWSPPEMKAAVDRRQGRHHRRARSRCTTTWPTTPARSLSEHGRVDRRHR